MDLLDDEKSDGNAPEFTVSEISGAVKKALEGAFGRVRVRGEIGRVMRAASGHIYYDLKDERNVISCNTWKGQVEGLGVLPEEGLEVIVTGKVSAFGGQSRYNINVDSIEVAGEGALMALLEKRKKALAAEGLFDEARKQPIPYLPEIIGVVTSAQGAVIRDILHRLRDRFPRKVLIWPVAVQGEKCAPQVAAAIRGFNELTPGGALPRPDLLIVARGGGSIEDLWGFNEEVVARAAAASDIPLISAVGHETDTTLIDFVSDRRAPTPTAAAEMAVPVRFDLIAAVENYGARMTQSVGGQLDRRSQRLRDLSRALPKPDDLARNAEQRLDAVSARLLSGLRSVAQTKRVDLERRAAALRPRVLMSRLSQQATKIGDLDARLERGLSRQAERGEERLTSISTRLSPDRLSRERAKATEQLMDRLARLSRAAQVDLQRKAERLNRSARLHDTLGYQATLERGYAVVWDKKNVVTTSEDAARASDLEIQFKDGRHKLGVQKSKASKKPPAPDQGSLF